MRFVKKLAPSNAFHRLGLVASVFAAMGFLAVAQTTPRIDRILRTNNLGRQHVEIHFSTDANRTYYLQAINACCGTNTATCTTNKWSNFATGYALPFTNHYIVPDIIRT